jgi:hypothetical protein
VKYPGLEPVKVSDSIRTSGITIIEKVVNEVIGKADDG